MNKNFPLSLFLCFSIGVFLLWILGTWQLNKNFFISQNNERFKANNKSNMGDGQVHRPNIDPSSIYNINRE